MLSYFVILVLFGLTSQYLLMKFGLKINLVSRSNFRRKINESIPLTGGIGIFLTLIFSQVISYDDLAIKILISFAPLAGIALADDFLELSAKVKVIFQIISASILVYFLGIENVFYFKLIGHDVTASLVSVLFIVVAMNAYNFLDGIDGQLSIIALIATFTIGAITQFNSNLLLSLIAANLCFFVFNGHKAKVYLGELGSSLLGFVLAGLALQIKPVENHWISFWAMNFMFSLAFCDVWAAIFRRLSRGQSPWSGDKEHFHHKLGRLGLSHLHSIFVTGLMMSISSYICYFTLSKSPTELSSWSMIGIGILSLSLVYFGVFVLEKIMGYRLKEVIHSFLEKRHNNLGRLSIFSADDLFFQFDLNSYVYEIQKYPLLHFDEFIKSLENEFSDKAEIFYRGDLKLVVKSASKNRNQLAEVRNQICKRINELLINSRFLYYERSIPEGVVFLSINDIQSELDKSRSEVSDLNRRKDKTFK